MNPEMGSDENITNKVDSYSRIDELTRKIFNKVESTTSPLCDSIESMSNGLESTLGQPIPFLEQKLHEMVGQTVEKTREIAREKHEKFLEYKENKLQVLRANKETFDEITSDPGKLVILFNAMSRAVNNSANARELYVNVVVNSPLLERLGMINPSTVGSTILAIIAVYFAADLYNNYEAGKAKKGVIEANAAADPTIPSSVPDSDVAFLFYEAIKSRNDGHRRAA